MRTAPPCKGADAHHPPVPRQATFARRRRHSRPRWTVRAAVPRAALNAAAENARAILILALAALGLVNVIASAEIPLNSLVAPLLALLTLAFFFAAQHSHDKRFSWLLSASVAAGLTIANVYDNLISTAPVACAAVLLTCVALLVVRRLTRRPRPSNHRACRLPDVVIDRCRPRVPDESSQSTTPR